MKKFLPSLLGLLLFAQTSFGQLTATLTPTNGTCQADGKLRISNISGGTPPYKVALIAGPGVPLPAAYQPLTDGAYEFTGLSAGMFTVDVLDDQGKTQMFSKDLTSSYVMLDYTPTPSLNVCSGNTYTGKITVTGLKGGKEPFRYSIISPNRIPATGFQSTGVFDNLVPGTTYEVQVWDACENFQTRQVQIPTIGGISLSDPKTEKTNCSGNYTATFTSTGGSGTITYQIIAPSFDQVGTNNTTGVFSLAPKKSYTIQASDVCGNITTSTIFVNEIIPNTGAWGAEGGANCGENDGAAYVWVTNGLAPYAGKVTGNCGGTPFSYTLNLTQQGTRYGEVVKNLPRPCDYTYTITDACNVVITGTFSQAPKGLDQLGGYDYLVCPVVSNNGYKVTIGASFGPPYAPSPNFTFELKNSDNVSVSGFPLTQSGGEIYPSLPPGNYTYKITDNCGSTFNNTLVIPNYPTPTLTIDGTNKCINAGQVTLIGTTTNVVEPKKEYKILSGPDRVGETNTTGVFSNLVSGGQYTFEFYDGCTKIVSPPFSVPPYQQPTFEVTYGALCSTSTASIQAFNRTKSVEPYRYQIIDFNSTPGYSTAPQSDSLFTNLPVGQYNIRGFDACQNSYTFLGKVGSLIKPVIDIPTRYCAGATVKLRATQCVFGATYTWYKDTRVIYTGPNHFLNIVNATMADGGTYTIKVSVQGTPTNCESTSNDVVLVVSPNLMLQNQVSCTGSPIDLTASPVTMGSESGTFSYWTNLAATSPLSNPNAVTNSGTYYIKIVTNDNCTITKPIDVNISNFAPTATGITVCSGNTIKLTASGGNNYNWTGPNGLITTSQNPVINNATPAMSGIYSVNVGVGTTCTANLTVNVTVNPTPTAGDDVLICSNINTYKLANAPANFTWSSVATNATGVQINASTGDITGLTTIGKYRFVLASTTCSDTVAITVTAIPMAGGDKAICSPSTTSSVSAATNTQTWSVVSQPQGASAIIAANGNITAMSIDGVYTFRITDGACFDEVQIIRKAKPNAKGDLTICSPQTTASLFIPTGTDFWSVVTSPANPSPATIVADFGDISGMANTGVYQFALNSNGCTDTVAVTKKTGITVTVTDTVRTCIAGSFTIITTSDAGAGATYSWKGPNGFTSSQKDATLANLVLASKGIYTLNVTSTTGCSATATSIVILNDISVAFLGGKLNYCVGETITIRTLDPVAGYTYDWTGPNGFSSMNTTNITRLTTPDKSQAGNYSIKITSPNGCFAVTTFTVTITECLSIGNLVWNDTNNDGLNNNGETGVGNVPVRLFKAKLDGAGNPTDVPDGTPIQTTSTDPTTGKYLFSGLIPGYYIVEIDAPAGYKSSTGTNGSATGPYESALNPNGDVNDNDDGTTKTGQIITSKAIELGNYTEPTGDGDTAPTGSDADKNSNLTIDFGIFKPASIGDFVWSDTNRDGVQDAGELGVTGIKVNLYQGTILVATTTTDANGKYLFDYLTPGTYTVEFVKSTIGANNSFSPLNGVNSTPSTDSNADPVTGKSLPITLAAGDFNQTIDAGITGDCPGSTVGTINVPALCAGATLTMQATSSDPSAKYTWTSTNSFTATTQSVTIPNLSTANAGTYTVLITNSNLCTSALTANVVVNPLPTLANVSGSMVCEGSSATLSASGATTYSWVGPNGYTSTSSSPIIINATVANAGVYTVTGATNGCTAIGLASLMVDKKPVPTATGAAICLGGNGSISVLPAGLTYAWSGPASFSSSQQTPTITNATTSNAGTYNVLVTDTKGCTATANAIVSVGNVLNITASSNSPICAGTRLDLSANGGVGASYAWTSPSGVTSNLANPFTNSATSADNGTWTVAVTNSDGCKGTGSTNVVINPNLTGIVATASAPVCAGGNITLGVKPDGATYAWSGTGFTSTLQNPTITSPTPGTYNYSVLVTNANGCTGTATVSTTIYALPTVAFTASSLAPVCFGSTVQLTGNTNGIKFAWTGPNNFNSSLQSPSISNATPSNSGTYTFVATNENSCNATATVLVTINDKLNGGNDLSICTPISTAQLTLVTGATWTSEATNPTGTTINNSNATVSGLSSVGTYIFYLSNTSGCKDTVKVFVNAKLDAGADKIICSPKSNVALLSLNGGQSWRYFANGSALPAPTVTGNNVTGISQDGDYLFILEQTGDNKCADTIKVSRKPSPNAGIDQVGTLAGICESQTTAKLTAAATGQTWSVAPNSVGFGTVTIDQTGTATNLTQIGKYIFVLKQGECTDTVVVERKVSPTFGLTPLQATCSTGAANDDAKLSITGLNLANTYDYTEGTSYTGTKTFATASSITVSTVTVTVPNPTADKNYTVRVFGANGCYTDKTVIVKTRICECKPDVCIPYSYKKTK